MLPFEPEPTELLRLRYADAVKDVIDINRVAKKLVLPPSKFRKHVFDFDDGLRIIVSRDSDGLRTFLHFSASVSPDSPKQFNCPEKYTYYVLEHIMDLSPENPPNGIMEAFFSEGGILHIIISGTFADPNMN